MTRDHAYYRQLQPMASRALTEMALALAFSCARSSWP